VSRDRSTLTAAPSSLVADGIANATLTATAKDRDGVPLSGRRAVFSVSGSANSVSAAVVMTDVDGIAVARLASTRAEVKNAFVSIDDIAVAQEASVTFTAGTPSLGLTGRSNTAGPIGPVAAGEAGTVTATILDANGNPVGGIPVVFATTSGTLSSELEVTDANGVAVVAVTSTVAGNAIVTATSGGQAVGSAATVSFVAAAATSLLFTVQPSAVIAGELFAAAVQASVTDRFGNLVASGTEMVALEIRGGPGEAVLHGVTSSATVLGIATFPDLSIHEAGSGYWLRASCGALAQADSATFPVTAANADPATSRVTAATPSEEVGGSVAVTAFVRDPYGNPVPGASVTFASSGSSNSIVQPQLPSDAGGMTTGSLSSTRAERKTITGSLGSGAAMEGTADVTFAPGPPSAATSALVATPTTAYDDGTPLSLLVTVKDSYSNPIAGADVILASTGEATFAQPSDPTGANGTVTGSVKAYSAGGQTITARVGASVVASADVVFTRAPASASASTVAVDRTTVPADGVTPAVVTVTVLDTIGRPMNGQSVQITYSGSGSVSPASTSTGPLGTATFGVTASAPTTGTVTATVDPGSSPLTLSAAPGLSFATFYRIGGSISGLSGAGLVLTTPGQPPLAVSPLATSFVFTQAVASGATYAVAVASQPSNQTCWVVNGRGGVTTSDVTTVSVSCSAGWASIAAGFGHTVAAKSDGTLWTWGANWFGQLGTLDSVDRVQPVLVGTGFSSAAAGYGHTVAVKADGTLWAWGHNNYGQLGTGDTTDRSSPVEIGTGFAAVAAGYDYTIALKADGTLWAFGINDFGQLGAGDSTSRSSPVQIGTGFASVAAGDYHALGLKLDGTLWSWGRNDVGQLGTGSTAPQYERSPIQIGTGFAAVAAGVYDSFAVHADGTLWAWGFNGYGQLGTGNTMNQLSPTQIGTGFTSVAAGHTHTVALKADGTAWAWGANGSGQVGDGTAASQLAPTQVGAGFGAITAGGYHTVAIRTDGMLSVWGSNMSGQLGTGGPTQPQLTFLQIGVGYVAEAAGGAYTLGLKADGTLWAWGRNPYGQLGTGDTADRANPVQVGTEFASMTAGDSYALAVKADSSLWGWGVNGAGALGTGDSLTRLSPVRIGTGYAWAAAGQSHTVALKVDGSLWAWGNNVYGQVGMGSTSQQEPSPVQVGTGFAAAAAGYNHTLAVKADGSLWAWGYNGNGQLGTGDTNERASPTQIGTGFAWVAAGRYHSVAVKADGTLWTWGGNESGQLGNGSTTPALTPMPIGTGFASVSVAPMSSSTVALKPDGTIWAWGRNDSGQLGTGQRAQQVTPVQVGAGFVAVAAGDNHTVAAKSDKTFSACGDDSYGQLGARFFEVLPVVLP
jgi:alpha-tubulin suppressor-like RCC1 family protein/protocatechuate 3,4-dioxygenase beta subunit